MAPVYSKGLKPERNVLMTISDYIYGPDIDLSDLYVDIIYASIYNIHT